MPGPFGAFVTGVLARWQARGGKGAIDLTSGVIWHVNMAAQIGDWH